MADAVKAITAKIEEIAKIKKELRVAINNAGGNLSETAPFSEYPDAIATIKNATFKILDKNMNTINITSNGQHSFSVNDDPGFAFTDGIPTSHKGWNSFSFNVNVESGSGSGGSGGGSGSGGSGGGSGSGGSGGGSGSEDSGPTLPKFAVFFKVKDNEIDPKYPWTKGDSAVIVEHGEDASPGAEPRRSNYDFDTWVPSPLSVTSSSEGMKQWDSSDPNYVEGTDGYMICYATWSAIQDEITDDWDYVCNNLGKYKVNQFKYLNLGNIQGYSPKNDGDKTTGYTGVVAPKQRLCMRIVAKEGNTLTWMSTATMDLLYPYVKLPDNMLNVSHSSEAFKNYIESNFHQYGDTHLREYLNTVVKSKMDEQLQPHIKAVKKKHQGIQKSTGASGICESTEYVWIPSYSEVFGYASNCPEGNNKYENWPYERSGSGFRSMVDNDNYNFYGYWQYYEYVSRTWGILDSPSKQIGFCT